MSESTRRLQLRSGGWVVLLAIACTGLAAWVLLRPVLESRGSRAIGDGRHVESYGFDLSALRVPRSGLAASNLPKDGLRALDDPATMPGGDVAGAFRGRRKYLVASDLVIGVRSGAHSRAYPLRVLNWHEVVNDTLGDRPIAVTWSPLSGGIAVFDRRLGGETARFGVSGLLYDSNLLLYDRRPGGRGESLWSQLRAEAVAGPAAAAGARLRALPCSRTTWGAWLRRHPDTTVMRPDLDLLASRYRRDPYGSYVVGGRPRFPADPPPPPGGPGTMETVMATRRSPAEPWTVSRPAELEADLSEPLEVVYAFWFAWHAVQR
jgi:hypothetical protein